MTSAFVGFAGAVPASISSARANSGRNRPSLSTGPRNVTSPLLREHIAPASAHLVPERSRSFVVAIRGREVADRGCARSAPRRIRAPRSGFAASMRALAREHGFQIVLFLHPAGRADRVAIGSDQHLIVVAHAPLATRQRSPRFVTDPGRECSPCAASGRRSHSAATRRPDTRPATTRPCLRAHRARDAASDHGPDTRRCGSARSASPGANAS